MTSSCLVDETSRPDTKHEDHHGKTADNAAPPQPRKQKTSTYDSTRGITAGST
jgi:hypothetical protein